MIQKFRKKPVIIEAMHFRTNNVGGEECMNEICSWIDEGRLETQCWHNGTDIYINTLEGEMRADCGDWIIKGIKGEFYPCKPDIFEATYEPVTD